MSTNTAIVVVALAFIASGLWMLGEAEVKKNHDPSEYVSVWNNRGRSD